jgi:DNA-directed RNA polymerase subunit RPC12/RpoP
MAFVEGGAFKCSAHDFETESVAEWNQHCRDNPIHTESGETLCTSCGTKIFFEKLPYHPIDINTGSKNISLRCEDCEDKMMGSVKRTSVKQVGAKQR